MSVVVLLTHCLQAAHKKVSGFYSLQTLTHTFKKTTAVVSEQNCYTAWITNCLMVQIESEQ